MTTLTALNSLPIAPVTGGAQAVAFSPNGDYVAAANSISPPAPNQNGRVLLFPVVTAGTPPQPRLDQPLALPTGASGVGYAQGLAFSPAHLLATANAVDGSVSLFTNFNNPGWAPVPGSPFLAQPRSSRDHPSASWVDPNALAFAPTQSESSTAVTAQLAVANNDNNVSLFSASSATGLQEFGFPVPTRVSTITGNGSTGIAFSHLLGEPWAIAPALLATANGETSMQGTTSLFVNDAGLQVYLDSPFLAGPSFALSLAFCPRTDPLLVAVALSSGGVALLIVVPPIAPQGPPRLLPMPGSPFPTVPADFSYSGTITTSAVAFNPTGTLLAVATTAVDLQKSVFRGFVSLFEVNFNTPWLTLVPGSPFPVSNAYANAVAFGPAGKLLAVASGDGFNQPGTVSLFEVV